MVESDKRSLFDSRIGGTGSISALRHRQCVHHSRRPSKARI